MISFVHKISQTSTTMKLIHVKLKEVINFVEFESFG
jgi:hypothetical protein